MSLESWLREDICNAEVFRANFTTLKVTDVPVVGECFICVKNYITSADLWVDEDFEMIEVEVKCMDPKYTWEIQSPT
jgi:hypothetical protein